METGKKKIIGFVISIAGLAILLFNAVNYIFGLDIGNNTYVVVGLIMVVIGAELTKKESKSNS